MSPKIGFIQNADLGRYLQSLDSVRFLESDLDVCKAQAKMELFTSLMLGRTIPIGEHQFIDSYGFLENAYELLGALGKMPQTERMQIEHVFPFQLYFRSEYKTIDGLIATKLGDPKYKLSLWQSLSDPDNYEDDDLVPSGDRKAAEMIHKMRDHFLRGEKAQIFTLYGAKTTGFAQYIGLLEAGISKISSWTSKDLIGQIKYQKRLIDKGLVAAEILAPELKEVAIELIGTLHYLMKIGLITSNRSDIRIGHKAIKSRGEIRDEKFKEVVNNDLLYEAILEIFDSLYNASIAKSCNAHSESVLSARSITNNEYIQAAIALSAMAKNEITDQADLKGEYFNPPWTQDLRFNLGSPSKVNLLFESLPWEHIWESYLDTNWRRTVTHLNHILSNWDIFINDPTTSAQKYMNITHELDDAYDAHIESISRILVKSGWDFEKNKKNNQVVIKFLPWASGLIAKAVAKLVIGQVSIDPFWEETVPDTIGAAAVLGVNKIIEPAGKWVTKGYIRKTFARLV